MGGKRREHGAESIGQRQMAEGPSEIAKGPKWNMPALLNLRREFRLTAQIQQGKHSTPVRSSDLRGRRGKHGAAIKGQKENRLKVQSSKEREKTKKTADELNDLRERTLWHNTTVERRLGGLP